jgi:hypothetical protein
MRTPRSLAGILAGALVALLLLSACSGGDDSVADPPVSPGSTSTSTEAPQRESPERFIRRWAAAEKQMENTGETSQYLSLSRGCGPCQKLASQVSGYYGAGGFVQWGGWRILSIKPYPGAPAPLFAVHSNSRPTRYRRSSDSPPEHFSGGPITYVLALKRHDTSWYVTNKSELDG